MKNRTIAILLAFFLGLLGFHKFYLNQNVRGFIVLLLTLTGVGLTLSIPWVLWDFITLILMGDGGFNKKFNKSPGEIR